MALDVLVEEPILRGESNGIGVLPDLSALLAFVVAVLAMQSVPAPNMMLVLSKGSAQGRRTPMSRVVGLAAASIKPTQVFGPGPA